MIRIAVTPAAFDAVADTMPLGSVGYEPEVAANGQRLIWVERIALDLRATSARVSGIGLRDAGSAWAVEPVELHRVFPAFHGNT
jgi:hypothetical protein